MTPTDEPRRAADPARSADDSVLSSDSRVSLGTELAEPNELAGSLPDDSTSGAAAGAARHEAVQDQAAPHDASESPVTVRRAVARRQESSDAPVIQPGSVTLPPPRKGPDKIFQGLTAGAGYFIVALIAAIALFLLMQAIPSLMKNQANFLTSTKWVVNDNELAFGIASLLWTTAISSIIAMLIAVPIAVGVALLITHYSGKRVGTTVGFLVDLLAAVPSVVYGLWGARVFGPAIDPISHFLQRTLGWFPLFGPGLSSTGTVFVASLVLAVMILPIVTSISRDVFAQTPRDHIEAAYALGSTKWEMIRTAVLPYGRSGVMAASMLGLGRALGETIAVMLILSTTNAVKINFSLFAGGQTFASMIANNAAEFDSAQKTGAYIAAGLVLFVLTFVVNAVARTIADRGKAK